MIDRARGIELLAPASVLAPANDSSLRSEAGRSYLRTSCANPSRDSTNFMSFLLFPANSPVFQPQREERLERFDSRLNSQSARTPDCSAFHVSLPTNVRAGGTMNGGAATVTAAEDQHQHQHQHQHQQGQNETTSEHPRSPASPLSVRHGECETCRLGLRLGSPLKENPLHLHFSTSS